MTCRDLEKISENMKLNTICQPFPADLFFCYGCESVDLKIKCNYNHLVNLTRNIKLISNILYLLYSTEDMKPERLL